MKKWLFIILKRVLVYSVICIIMMLLASSVFKIISNGILKGKEKARVMNIVLTFRNWEKNGRPQGEAFEKAMEQHEYPCYFCISNIVLNVGGNKISTKVAWYENGSDTYFVAEDERVFKMEIKEIKKGSSSK